MHEHLREYKTGYDYEVTVVHNSNLVSNSNVVSTCHAWMIANNIDWSDIYIGLYMWTFGFKHKKDAMHFKLVWG